MTSSWSPAPPSLADRRPVARSVLGAVLVSVPRDLTGVREISGHSIELNVQQWTVGMLCHIQYSNLSLHLSHINQALRDSRAV